MSELIVHCPECATAGKPPKLYINAELGVFNCYVCGFKGRLKALYKYPQLISKLEAQMDLAAYAKLKSFKPLEVRNIDVLEEMNPVREVLYDDPQYAYLISRGWDDTLINTYRPLVSMNPAHADRVILPVIDNDKIVYYTARSMNKDSVLKYKNPSKVSRKNIMFKSNVPESVLYPKDMVILEGIFDAYKVPNAVALLGKTVSQENEDQLLSIASKKQDLYVCLDTGAEQWATTICKKLYSWFPTKNIYSLNTAAYGDMDLGDMSKVMTSVDLLSWIKSNSIKYQPVSLSASITDRIFKLSR